MTTTQNMALTTEPTVMASKRQRIVIPALGVVLAVVLALGTAWLLHGLGSRPPQQAQEAALIGGPFSLVSHTGEVVTDQDLAGQPFALFFGFTHCPDVCPMTLWEISQALEELGPAADELTVLFVTVDPARDTPELLSAYLQSFDPRIVGLTGSEEEIASLGKAYRAYWQKVETEAGDYTVDHTTAVYLMDDAGKFVSVIRYDEDHASRLEKLQQLVTGGSA